MRKEIDENILLSGSKFLEQKEYWQNKLSGDIAETTLVTGNNTFKSNGGTDAAVEKISIPLTDELCRLMVKLSKNSDLSIYLILLAALKILIYRYTDSEDITTLSPICKLNISKNTITRFLFIRNRVIGDITFKELLLEIKTTVMEAYNHQDYPIKKILELLFPDSQAKNEGFISNIECSFDTIHSGTNSGNTRGKLSFAFRREGNNIPGNIFYDADTYDKGYIERILNHYVKILENVTRDVNIKVGEISFLSSREKRRLLIDFNNNEADFPNDKTVHQLIEEQTKKNPRRIALTCEGNQLTYGWLNERVNQLAHVLKEKGITHDQLAGILLERSIEMVIGILGVWKAGGAYIPIDINNPLERIKSILSDSRLKVLLTKSNCFPGREKFYEEISSTAVNTIICLDETDDVETYSQENPPRVNDRSDICYVIYTSGSTGKPKGVMVEHLGMMNHIQAKVCDLQVTERSIIAQNSSHTFDISVWQFFTALTLGGQTAIYPNELVMEPEQFISRIVKDQVTILEVVPSYLSVLLEYLKEGPGVLLTLDYLLVTGETVKPLLVKNWFEIYPHIKMVNAYGPTEASDDITHYIMDRSPGMERIPIGSPLQNLNIYIVDQNMQLCPVGVKGEICVSGIGVGRGYLNNPEKTAEKFNDLREQASMLLTPHSTTQPLNHSTIYRTGDLGCWLPDGSIAFSGRKDYQVKIRGFRIELEEIERKLILSEKIKEAVVMDRKDKEGNTYICAYIVTSDGNVEPGLLNDTTSFREELQEYLSERLPDYMIPEHFVLMEKMTLTPNGKVNRKALPEPGVTARGEYEAPRNKIEEDLQDIWSDVLGIQKEKIGINADFFELGGHSLKVTILVSRIHKRLGVKLALADVFNIPTIKGLAEYMIKSERENFLVIEPTEKKEYYELSSTQKRLYILQQMDPGNIGYNMPGTFSLRKDVNLDKLEDTFEELIGRHESLRTSFDLVNEGLVQRIHDHVEFKVEYYERTVNGQWSSVIGGENVPYSPHSNYSPGEIISNFVRPFDLSKVPLLRVGLIKTDDTKYLLMVDMHHIISDGISHLILEREFEQIYNGNHLPVLGLQYKDYAQWQNSPEQQRKIKEQEKYWLEVFPGELPMLDLPTDYPRPAVQGFKGDSIHFELNEKETENIKRAAEESGTTLYMLLLSIYNILLSKWSGQEDIVVGTPIAARRHPDLEKIIGMFVNTLALCNFPSGDKTFKEFLKEVKKRTLEAYENQEYQFEDLVDKLSIPRDTSRNPIFDVVFNFFDQVESGNNFSKIEEENNYQYQNKSSKFDLTLRAMDLGEKLFFNLEYSTELFAHQTIVKVIGYFKQIVKGIASCLDRKISDIEIIPENIRKEKLDYFNEDLKREGEVKTIQMKLNDSFPKYKNNIAIEYGNTHLTYGELEGKSACIANWLIVNTVKKGSFIGIYMEDKIEVISAIIGILNAGCVFVPLDSKLPVKRIEHMIQSADIRLVFTDAGNEEILAHFGKNFLARTQPVVLDNLFYKMAELSVSHNAVQDVQYSNEDKAYVYFTSGSTGMPQAVIGKNESLVQFIEWEVETFSIDETYRISQLAAVGFDAFLRNVFNPLFVGGTVCIPGTRELVMDSEGLVTWIDENRITLVHCVPSVFRLINAEKLTTERFSHLKYIVMSGEQISPNELRRWYDVFGDRIQLVNCYGATETTVIRTFHFIREGDIQRGRIPAGVPIDNSRIIILDRNMNICPQGIVGEIYVRTPYRSFGYLNDPELTTERFIKNPFNWEEETDIIFKSGDLGRELGNGDIEILGRKDRQVKIRGVRIELESIENYLLKHQKINKSVVTAKKDENGENYLCAYIVNNVDKKQEAAGNSIAGERNGYGYRLEASLKNECKENKIFFNFDFVDDDYCQNKAILELFKDQALKNPDHVVILSKDEHITFRALDEKVNQLSILLNKNGAKEYTKVGILLEKTSDIITGMAGITKAGGEFLLIDPRLPSDRIVSIMKENNAFLLLTEGLGLKERSFTVLQDIQSGRAPVEITSPRKAISNLNELPIPDRSKVDYEKYTKFIGQSLVKNSITLMGSRGCPFKCAYCHKIWPKKQISRSAENIFNELQLYYNIGFRRFVFLDDIFNLDVGNTVRFFEMIIERGLDSQLCLNLRGDILTKEYIDLMVKAGVIRCAFALETASPRLQKLIRKNLNLQRFKENMEYICSVHPQVILEINTMHGFPTETEEEAMATLKFIKDLKWVHFPYINILKIYPNTDMEKLALANGISQESIDKSASLAYHELPDTLHFDKSFTLKYQMELMSDYFLLKERLLQVLPYQLEVLTEDEIVQKYNSYLPVDINSFDDLLKFANISKDESDLKSLKNESHLEIPNLNRKIKGIFPPHIPQKDALRVLLLDLSQFFTADSGNILYDVVEAPLGLMYLMAYLNSQYKGKIHGKIAKSRIDFDNFAELKGLLDEFKPDLIGIRTLTYFKEFFHKSISMMRQWGVDVPIIAGGPYATSDYKTILKDKHVDLAVLGEGEETLGQLVGAMIASQGKLPTKKDLKNIRGIAFVSRGEYVEDGSTNEIIMLDALGIRTGSYAYDSRSYQINGDRRDPVAAILYPSDTGNASTPSELREYLSKVFPDYMIPSYFVPIEEIPLTLNGKIDWRRLPEPEFRLAGEYVEPKNEVEKKLIALWADLLKVDREIITPRSNFFELGGHSLKATILTAKIHQEFDVKVPLVEVFKNQTIGDLAVYIRNSEPKMHVSIEPLEKREYYELSSAQKRLYILQQMDLESTAYHIPGVIYLAKGFDRDKLEETFRELIRRHESLRTSFMVVDDEPVQKIHDHVEFRVEYYSPPLPIDIISNFVRPFDLSKAPLLRVGLIHTLPSGHSPREGIPGDKHILLVDMHHIISDGTSHDMLREEFQAINSGRELPGLRLQYKDYAIWQNSQEERKIIKNQETYWLKEFSDELPVLNLITDYPRPVIRSFAGNTIGFWLNKEETRIIKDIAKKTDITLYMVILSIYNILLAKLSGQEDIIVGTAVAGRRHAEVQRIIGMFVNTIPLRHFPSRDKTVKEFLVEVKKRTLEAFENQEYPFEKLVDQLAVERDTGRNPVFDVVFNLLNQAEYSGEHIDGNEKEKYIPKKKVAKFDLTLTGIDVGEYIYFAFEYCVKLFESETINRFIRYFRKIISVLGAGIEQPISAIETISREEKEKLLFDFNDTQADYPTDKTIHELFEEQAERRPDGVAVVGKGKGSGETETVQLTFWGLNKKSNQVASVLRGKGVGPDTIVGIMVNRWLEMIIGIMGILKSGGAYLPIDPNYPQDRIDYMLKDSAAKVLVITSTLAGEVEKFSLEEVLETPESSSQLLSSSNLAYVIYTSGTTGKPKGVMIQHQSLVNLCYWHNSAFQVTGCDQATLYANYCFDASVWELFPYLLKGAALHLIDEVIRADIEKLNEYYCRHHITISFLPTQVFEQFIKLENSSLRLLLTGADKLNHFIGKNYRLINNYGPTENTVVTTSFVVEKDYHNIPIGKPLSNVKVYIVDKKDGLSPIGVSGELCVGGDGLARGYLNNVELTGEKFTANPFAPGAMMYKTGDLARRLPDGNIEFSGRIDHQVKIRGFRVEPGEIENRLLKLPQIKEAVVLAREDKTRERYLCAYIVSQGSSVDIAEIKQGLSESLPDYMVPAYFMELDKIPLTPNGKVDRRALPEPEIAVGGDYIAPRNELERKLAGLWSDILNVDYNQVSMDSNFFALGGHSLKATILAAKIHKEINVKVPLAEIFKSRTIMELSQYIKSSGQDKYISIEAVERKKYYELSSAQKRLYVLQQMDEQGSSYNIPSLLSMEGNVNKENLGYTFRKLIARHESLRTSFEIIKGTPVQKIHDPTKVEFEMEYFEAQDTGQRVKDEGGIIKSFIRPFDLSRAPLLRVGLIHTPSLTGHPRRGVQKGTHNSQEGISADQYILMVDMHHIISDGTSMDTFVKEFMALYGGKTLPVPRIQYKDFSEWQKSKQQRQAIKQQEAYWIKEFAGEIPVLNLPTDYLRPPVQSFEGSSLLFEIDNTTTDALKTLAAEEGSTLFMVLLFLYKIFLSKISNQDVIVVGTPIEGRRHADLREIIGMFVNTLTLKSYPIGEKNCREFLAEVKESVLEAFANQDYPYEELVEKVAVNRDTGRNPLFDVMFLLQNMDTSAVDMAGLTIKPFGYEESTSKFDLTLQCSEMEDKLSFAFNYCTKLFRKETLERFIKYFHQVISRVLAEPDKKIADLEIISEAEKEQILLNFNDTNADYPKEKTIHGLFEEQVEKTPDNAALLGADGIPLLSYKEMNENANGLANRLIEARIDSNKIVGIMVERSIDMLVSIFGILKAGGIYLPINPDYPRDRINYILKDSGTQLLLTRKQYLDPSLHDYCQVIDLSDEDIYNTAKKNPEKKPIPSSHPIYVIYTSGSTGKPKGVMIEHRMVVNRLNWMQRSYPIDERDVLLQKTPFVFDVSVWELFWWSFQGAALSLLGPGKEKNPEAVIEAIEKAEVTVIHFVPSLLNALFEYIDSGVDTGKLTSLKYVFASGEALLPHQVHKFNRLFKKHPKIRLINLYGPTEATVDVSYYNCAKDRNEEIIPIGKPIDNIQLLVVSKNLQLQPCGIVGELCISGAGVARGYLNNIELTKEKFIVNPSLDGKKVMYKTGDLVRWLPDGNIEILGRIDHQVKIRGNRIELGEIENRLLENEKINEAVVVVNERHGDKHICAYIVAGEELEISELREYLSAGLADYMIPSYFVQLERIPLTPNGKVDRRSLPEPELGDPGTYVGPRDDIERKLVTIWSEVFNVEKDAISIDSSFFELGGHSITAAILAARVHKEWGVKLPLAEIFKRVTIRRLSRFLKDASEDRFRRIEPAEKKDYYKLSSAQKRLYFLQQMDLDSISYNMPQVVILENEPDLGKLEQAFRRLIERHESFRTSFEMVDAGVDSEPVQRIHPQAPFKVEIHETETLEEVRTIIHEFIRPFDISTAPLIRGGFVKTRENQYALMSDMHHIISDGISMAILIKEFEILYSDGQLPELPLQYKDYSQWQNRLLASGIMQKQKEYWLDRFGGNVPQLHLPIDDSPDMESIEGDKVVFGLNHELYREICSLALETGSTLYMVLLAAYNILLSRYTEQEDILVGAPIFGRNHTDLQHIIGMFVNLLPILNHPRGDKTFLDFLMEVKENALRAYENQDYQFEQMVWELGKKNDGHRQLDIKAVFVSENVEAVPRDTRFHRAPDPQLPHLSRLAVKPYPITLNISKFELTLTMIQEEGEIILDFEYKNGLFRKQTVKNMATHLITILNILVMNPHVKIADIDILSEEEENRLITEIQKDEDAAVAVHGYRDADYPQNNEINVEFDF